MSGTNWNLNRLIERNKDNWDTGTEALTGDLIRNASDKYNNMVSAKKWTKTDPKDAKISILTTCLPRSEKKMSVFVTVQGGVGNIT